MAIIVQKYGGTSVANADRIRNVAQRIARQRAAGYQMVAVVSAMGDTTDDLLALASQITDRPNARELDVLLSTGEIVSSTLVAMALRHMGVDAISLSGLQAGIQTDGVHTKARIRNVAPERILRELERGHVVIVAGFQGVTEELDVTTLGRGASDLTGVALAAALGAERYENLKDVEGVYTADPRLVPKARKLRDIGYEEMLELASHGAQVVQARAVELAALFNVPILVASSFNNEPGTLIHAETTMEPTNKVRGVTYDRDVAKITVRGVPDRPGIAATLFEPMADHHISVDTIVQNASLDNLTDMTFTVSRTDLRRAMEIIEPVAKGINAGSVVADERLGKVSVVGTGMQNTPGYASRMFRSLFDAGINILLITTSEIRITCIIEEAQVNDAVRALHDAFELEQG